MIPSNNSYIHTEEEEYIDEAETNRYPYVNQTWRDTQAKYDYSNYYRQQRTSNGIV
jgi:hypothetical protein